MAPTSESAPAPHPLPPLLGTLYGLSVGLAGLGALGYWLAVQRDGIDWPQLLLFWGLSLLVQRSSLHLGSPVMHSLSGVIDIAAILTLGPAGGGVVAAGSGLTLLVSYAIQQHGRSDKYLFEVALFNAGLKASMALLGGMLYELIAAPLPVEGLDGRSALALAALCLFWFSLDHLAWGIWMVLTGGVQRLRRFGKELIPKAVLIELVPLPTAMVVALVHTRLGGPAFVLLDMAIVAIAVLASRWADARREQEQRVTELSAIKEAGRAMAEAQLDVDAVCRLVYQHATQIADATIFHLGLFEGDKYALKLWIREGEPEEPRTFELRPGTGVVNWLRESKQAILVRDFQKELDSLPAKPAYVSDKPPRSALFVPLLANETVIGTLSLQSYKPNAYGHSDLRVLGAMANQAALAIQKARLYGQERRRVRQLETIGQVTRQVTTTIELNELFERVVHLIRDSFGYYHVALYTADPERRKITYQASASAGQQNVAPDVEWGQGLVGWVAAQARAVTVNDVKADGRYQGVEALEETRSELVVPLRVDDELVGMLDVQSNEADAFGADDLFILETLGDQIALAIQEARLYEAERQQAWFSTVLLQIADAMSNVSDMDAVLATIVRLTPILVGVDRCAILLWDADSETFLPGQAHGLSPRLRERFDQLLFPSGVVPALDEIRWSKSPLLARAGGEDALIPPDMVSTFDTQEMVLLPLLAQGEFLGAMMVDYAGKASAFSEPAISMLSGIANQAAMVLQSARLVQAQKEEAYVSMALLQVAEAVSRSSELQEALSAVARITPMLAGVEACALFVYDRSVEAFVPSSQYGLDKAVAAAFRELRFGKDDALGQGLLAGEPFLPCRELLGWMQARSEPNDQPLLALPLAIKGDIVGGMLVSSSGPRHRSAQRWMSILTGIASQAAIAVENDRLLQEVAEQERMKQELDVARRIQTSFLPDSCPTVPGWEFAAVWRAARQVGGDFYDFIPLYQDPARPGLEGERLGVVVADVADKGVPAALFMALCRTLMRTVAIDGRPPGAAVARVNELILADAPSDLFVTLFYAILEPSGEVSYVNAGHMPPLVVRGASGDTEELRTGGMALGVIHDIDVAEEGTHLERGDALVMYTDGVTEASDSQQQMFGRERLIDLVRANRGLSAAEQVSAIRDAVATFVGDAPKFDDLTLVIAKRK